MSLIFRRIGAKFSIIILVLFNVCIPYEVRAEELQTLNNYDSAFLLE